MIKMATVQLVSCMHLAHITDMCREDNYCQKFSICSSYQAPSCQLLLNNVWLQKLI
jgi:hypothetical protein